MNLSRTLSSFWSVVLVTAAGLPAAVAQPLPSMPSTLPPPAAPMAPAPRAASPPPRDLVGAVPGGLTADQVAARAERINYNAKAAAEQLRAAAARVDQAWSTFLPRLTGTGRYTRLSSFVPPTFGTGSIVVTPLPVGAVNPTPTLAGSLVFPLVLDNYLLQASIVVPFSDYFLRIAQNYTAATQARDAADFDLRAARARAGSDGKVTFYGWLRARGAVEVAKLALGDQQNHLRDAQHQFDVGNASRADVLRAETAVAQAELQVARAENLSSVAERQVRQAIRAADDAVIVPGDSLDAPVPPATGTLKQFVSEAFSSRYELRSFEANIESTRQQAKASRAAEYPQLSGVGNLIYANPNSRRVPQTPEWFATWDVGAQITWSPNDILAAGGAGRELEARAASLASQRDAARDSIEIEVTQAWNSIVEADVGLSSSARQLASATEAYRVARELFNAGRATSTTLTDAETELTRARLDALNSTVDARVARVRLEHAVGRDAPRLRPSP